MVSFRTTLAAASLFAVTLAPAFANVIHFTGQIVEDPCNISPGVHRLSITCPQDKKMTTQQVSYQEAINGNVPAADRATVSMKYINPQKSLAIVQVDYR
ncbi:MULTISPECIES: type 1 fimbrial protein [unclassified Leclercia]|uniref:type 1 fimbrial protein n=1 Tax=Leclercia TaxID=83654 RepID=UPI002072E35F|nr:MULTISPECIES: type 1 fimbrial protein [unclassified Leclercia]MCM5695788.1 type 1 fimbrial protein [Leclercia sp. LTM01]